MTVEEAPIRSEQWAVNVALQANLIEQRLHFARSSTRPDERWIATATGVQKHVDLARAAIQRPRSLLLQPLDRFRGTSIEIAYQNLHAANVGLVDLLPDEDVDAMIPEVSQRLAVALEPADPRRAQIAWGLGSPEVSVRRAAVRNALESAYNSSDRHYARLRSFRNLVLTSAVLISALVGLFVVVSAANPQLIPLCFQPVTSNAQGQFETTRVCPSGSSQPSAHDAALIALLGLLGGAAASAATVRNLRASSSPYNVILALALLKLPTGSLTAILGLLLLAGDFVPGFSELDTQAQILAYAMLFGFAQQLFTRTLDIRAQDLLGGVPVVGRVGHESAPRTQESPPEPMANDIRKALDETVHTQLTNALRRPAVSNVEGSISAESRRGSTSTMELIVDITTGFEAWRNAAEANAARRFRLKGGEDRPSASFEIVVDAPGFEVAQRRQTVELGVQGGSHQWTIPVIGEWAEDALIWITLYSSGRYIQAIQPATSQVSDDVK